MAPKVDLVNVKVSVNGKEQVIKMERGTSFENKGGIFTAGETNGVLKMTNYQARTFLAMANNSIDDNETIKYDEILKNKKNEINLTGAVLSKKDIQEAQQKYRNRGFVADMSEFLPEGYKIERPKLISAENMVQAYVTNGKESQSATLKFSFKDLFNKQAQQIPSPEEVKVVNIRDLNNHENKRVGVKDGKLVDGYEKIPYIENGVIRLDYDNAKVTCTYEHGKLLKYDRTVTKDPSRFDLQVSAGDFQRVEFYPNGNIKSLDINIIQYGEFEGARFYCQYDEEGNYISGEHCDEMYKKWVDMSKEEADFYIDVYPMMGVEK